MTALRQTILLVASLSPSGVAASKPAKLPADAPYCARPNTPPVFVSPVGEPFRAPAGQPYPSAQWVATVDANHDGRVDRAEIVADARRFFARLDLDHDGRLTPEEVAAYERDVAPEIALYAGPREGGRRGSDAVGPARDRSGGYGGPLGAGRYAWLNIPEPVAAADADINRIVTADEFAAAAGRRFDSLDMRHAGALALADFGRTPQQVAIEGPCQPRPKPRRDRSLPVEDDPRAGEGQGGAP